MLWAPNSLPPKVSSTLIVRVSACDRKRADNRFLGAHCWRAISMQIKSFFSISPKSPPSALECARRPRQSRRVTLSRARRAIDSQLLWDFGRAGGQRKRALWGERNCGNTQFCSLAQFGLEFPRRRSERSRNMISALVAKWPRGQFARFGRAGGPARDQLGASGRPAGRSRVTREGRKHSIFLSLKIRENENKAERKSVGFGRPLVLIGLL